MTFSAPTVATNFPATSTVESTTSLSSASDNRESHDVIIMPRRGHILIVGVDSIHSVLFD